jgi:CRISPR type III-A-associated protein Csm2
LKRYKELIGHKDFTDDEVMQLSEKLGESLASSQRSSKEGDGKDNTKNQVRKFYNLVRVAHTSARPEEADPKEVKIKLRSLQAQVAYAAARKTISTDFKMFLDESLNEIFKSDDLKRKLSDFMKFFEAFYAYFYFHTEVKPQ